MVRHTYDAVVVGGGLIGLSVAWRARQRGLSVAVVDATPGQGASQAAAGMLAPVTEAMPVADERATALLRLNLASAALYPAFVAELEEAAGTPVGYRDSGTLVVAVDADDQAELDELAVFLHDQQLSAERLTSRECRALEPLLAPSVRGALMVPGDHQVDNRLVLASLLTVLDQVRVPLHRQRAAELLVVDDAARGVRLADGQTLHADSVVLAAGCWSSTLVGLPPDALPTVRPVKGQILRLGVPDAHAPFPTRNIRALARGSHVYLAPREHGVLVVGATVEELGYDTRTTAGAVYELLRDARAVLPAVTELTLLEAAAALRPATADHTPLLGPTRLPGLVAATGHFRNGVLLTPITADAIAEALATGTPPPVIAPFVPGRASLVGGGTA
jgi:glycine oxidase